MTDFRHKLRLEERCFSNNRNDRNMNANENLPCMALNPIMFHRTRSVHSFFSSASKHRNKFHLMTARYLPKFVIAKGYGTPERQTDSVRNVLTARHHQSEPRRFTCRLFQQISAAKDNHWTSRHQLRH